MENISSILELESFVSEKIGSSILENTPISFSVNSDPEFGLLGSRCILDFASRENLDPNTLTDKITSALNDNRFSIQRGFLNFTPTSDKNWLFSLEHTLLVKDKEIFILKDDNSDFTKFRLKMLSGLQKHLFKDIDISIAELDSDTIFEKLSNAKNGVSYTIWTGPKGLDTKLYNLVIQSEARKEKMLSFQTLTKPYIHTSITELNQHYFQRVLDDKIVLANALYYYSYPHLANEVDPETPFIQENANLVCFFSRIFNRLNQILVNHNFNQFTGISIPDEPLESIRFNALIEIASLLKVFPLIRKDAFYLGNLFVLTSYLYKLMTKTEKLINHPNFRVVSDQKLLNPIELFIVNMLSHQLNCSFEGVEL